jgi:DNA-binding transcriptional MocR family regulator
VAARDRPPPPLDLTARAYQSLRQMILEGKLTTRRRLSHRNLSRDLGIGRKSSSRSLRPLPSWPKDSPVNGTSASVARLLSGS